MVPTINTSAGGTPSGYPAPPPPPPPPVTATAPQQAKTPPNFEDALNSFLHLRQLEQKGTDLNDQAHYLSKLVESTVQWKHTPIRSYRLAVQQSANPHHRLHGRLLPQEFHELICLFTRLLTRQICRDNSAEWAIRSLVLLVDDMEKLYDNRVSQQNQTSRYWTQEGAEKDLAGVAAATFREEGGCDILMKAIGQATAGPLDALVQLQTNLIYWGPSEDQHADDFCAAAGNAILQMNDADLIGSRDHLQKALENLLQVTEDRKTSREASSSKARTIVESAWWRFVSRGVCSQNLLARRSATSELGEARARGISPSSLTKWLAEDRIFEELFGPRSDSRVIEDLNLSPLCEPTVEGLRALLEGLRPALGTADVLHKKLYQLTMGAPQWKRNEWGCDLILVELMRWARNLLQENSVDAVAFITGFFSQTTTNSRDQKKQRVFPYILDVAVTECVLTIVEAMLSPAVTEEQLVNLDAAYDDSKHDRTGDSCRWQIWDRIKSEVQESNPSQLLRRPVLRMLLRLLQSFPVEVEDEDEGKKTEQYSREEAVMYLQQESPPLSKQLWLELCWFLKEPPGPDFIVDVQIRLRVFCYVYRCTPKLSISGEQLQEMLRVLLEAPEAASHICYLLRISSTTASMHTEEVGRAFPALSDSAMEASLRFLEDWAVQRDGLDLPGFFCLVQAILLVNESQMRLRLLNDNDRRERASRILAGLAVPCGEKEDIKISDEQRVGMWARILQDEEGNYKIGRLGMFNTVDRTFLLEYIDETTHHRKNLRNISWRPLPTLLEQQIKIPTVLPVKNPEELAGLRGLWACALSSSNQGGVESLAADFILALHTGTIGAKALLNRLSRELASPTTTAATSRCLSLLNTLVMQQPPSRARSHIGPGFPMRLSVTEYIWVKKETLVKHWDGSQLVYRKEQTDARQPHHSLYLTVHSNMTLHELHRFCTVSFNRRAVRLRVRFGRRLVQNSRQTLEEVGLVPDTELEADEDEPVMQEHAGGVLDEIGDGEGSWNNLLLTILGQGDSNTSEADRSLCWRLLLRLPTYDALKEMVRKPVGQSQEKWEELLSKGHFWRSTYTVLLIEAYAPQLQRPQAGNRPDTKEWLKIFEQSGGAAALLKLFFEICKSDSGLGTLELSSMLPPLVRAVGACVIGVTNAEGGFVESLKPESCCELLSAAAFATRWLFNTSQTCDDLWQRLRQRHAAADSLELLVEVERRGEPPLEMLDKEVLPLLVELMRLLEGPINARVAGAVVALARRPACAQMLLQRFAVELPAVAAPLDKPSVSVEALCGIIGQVVGTLDSSAAKPERAALLEAVVRSVLSCNVEVAGLYRLLAIDVSGVAAVEEAVLLRLLDRLVQCLLPRKLGEIGADETRDAGAKVLIQLLPKCTWKLRLHTLQSVFSFMAEVQAPEGWNFEPTIPEEPDTKESCRRNATGYAGLTNRGMTCYMNSTLQQLYWSQPFRRAVLLSPPPLLSTSEKPEPLPESLSASTSAMASRSLTINIEEDKEKEKTISTPSNVGWQIQRLFSYLENCHLGLCNTDQLVDACSNLNLEYNVRSMNDAPEFFDKLLDKIDEVCVPCSDSKEKPSSVFLAKTEKEKHCHHCGLRTKAPPATEFRVQINELYPTLEECLQKITETETMMGDNRVDCDSCKQKRDTSYQTYFTQLPQILVFHLGRMWFNLETLDREKRNDRIVFPIKLSMAKYTEDAVLNGQESVQGCTYELQGVQVHQGTAHAGHYYSFAQDAQGKWFKFNDDHVSPFDLEDLDDECFGGEGHGKLRAPKSHNAYMLYYRCVEAAPYKAANRSTSKTPKLQRSKTDDNVPPDIPAAPALVRTTTTQSAVGGEQLQQLMKQRRQSQLASSLKEEIQSINEQLHRHAVVFSPVTLRFLLDFAGQLCTALAAATSGSGDEADADLPIGDRRAPAEEGLCRLTAKALFDVVLHAKGVDKDKEQLEAWVNLFTQQFKIAGSAASGWLVARLGGLPDDVLGRRSSSWLSKAVVGAGVPACKGVIRIAVAAAEAVVSADASATSFHKFVAASIMLMGSVETPQATLVYGELWNTLVNSPILRPVLLEYRASGDLSVTSLLLHAFCGGSATVYDSPPAPPLPARGELRYSFPGASMPLLNAAAGLLNHAGPKADKSLTPLLESALFWRALAVRNPRVFEDDTPYRRLFPVSQPVQVAVGKALIERLRPTGSEKAESLQAALKFVLLAGDEPAVDTKLSMLCQAGRELVVAAGETSRLRSWNYQSAQEKNNSPKNPEAVQLLRLLQVVASLGRPLAEPWSWARDWLTEVCSKRDRRQWEDQGLVISEVEKARAALKGPGGEALPAEPELSASDIFITVSHAGSRFANGRYFFRCEDTVPYYQHEADQELTLYQEENRSNLKETRWAISQTHLNPESMWDEEILYTTNWHSSDSQWPPTDPHQWFFIGGDEPMPCLQVAPLSSLPPEALPITRNTSPISSGWDTTDSKEPSTDDDLYDTGNSPNVGMAISDDDAPKQAGQVRGSAGRGSGGYPNVGGQNSGSGSGGYPSGGGEGTLRREPSFR